MVSITQQPANFPGGANAGKAITPFDARQAAKQSFDRSRRLLGWQAGIRPFGDPEAGKRVLQQILKKRNKPGESTDATIIWGAASNFDIVVDNQPTVQIQDGQTQQQQDQQTAQQTIIFTEVARETEKVRVTNPDDSDQWVEVERIKTITFDSSNDKIRRKFVLHWT